MGVGVRGGVLAESHALCQRGSSVSNRLTVKRNHSTIFKEMEDARFAGRPQCVRIGTVKQGHISESV